MAIGPLTSTAMLAPKQTPFSFTGGSLTRKPVRPGLCAVSAAKSTNVRTLAAAWRPAAEGVDTPPATQRRERGEKRGQPLPAPVHDAAS